MHISFVFLQASRIYILFWKTEKNLQANKSLQTLTLTKKTDDRK